MGEYVVTVKEIWNVYIEVKANSKEEALDLVDKNYGCYEEINSEFNHILDSSLWEVEEVKNGEDPTTF